MKTLNELEHDVDKMFSICDTAKCLYIECRYLYIPETPEEKFIIQSEPFLQNTRNLYWVMTIVQICKLYGREKGNDDFSIRKLLKEMIDNYEVSEWNNKISKIDLVELQKKLKEEATLTWIEKIKKLRDKFYVHTDKNTEGTYQTLFVDNGEIEKLLKIGNEILEKIRLDIFHSYSSEESSESQHAKNFLKRMSMFVIKKTEKPKPQKTN